MYPNLYYVFQDWFGVEWPVLKVLNTFGLMVALSFVAAAWVITSEFKRKEKQGLLHPREEIVVVGRPASIWELFINAFVGFLFGYKIIGLLFFRTEDINPQEYLFSSAGSIVGGLVIALTLAGIKWYDRNKQKLKTPERRTVRIWPHDRVGDIVILALVFGILGSKLFDNLEHWDKFMADPIGSLLEPAGLTFYGGLIVAAIAIIWFAYKKGINIRHLVDSAAPAIMIAYAVGRLGCQIAGDGDWGVFNSAYDSDPQGNLSRVEKGTFEQKLLADSSYYTLGKVKEANGDFTRVTDRAYGTIEKVPSLYVPGASFLPKWFFAYSFPQNVNDDGVVIPGNTEDHNRVLPHPVLPTSLWETVICGLMFVFMWAMRRKIKIPLMMFSIYLVLNGAERFFIETIRVNKTYDTGGVTLSQAEIIAICLVIAGLLLAVFAYFTRDKKIAGT